MSKVHSQAYFSVVSKLFAHILFCLTYMDRFIKWIHPDERKIIRYYSPAVSILMVNNDGIEAEMKESGTWQEVTEDLTLLETITRCDPKFITVSRQWLLNAMCEKPVSVSIQVAGLIEVINNEIVAENHACMNARSILGVYSRHHC